MRKHGTSRSLKEKVYVTDELRVVRVVGTDEINR